MKTAITQNISVLVTAGLLAIQVQHVNAVTTGWNTLFRHDCNGGYEVTPNFPWGFSIDLPQLERAIRGALYRVKSRAKCQCPTLSDKDFNLMYDPMTAGLNIMMSTTEYPSTCAGQFKTNLTEFGDAFDWENIPSSCTLSSWRNNGECNLKLPIQELDLALGLSVWKCPTEIGLPGFALSCIGSNCDKIFQPCNDDSDCGSTLACAKLYDSPAEQTDTAYDALNYLGLSSESEKPGCFNTGSGNPSTDVTTAVMTYARKYFGSSATTSNVAFCGIRAVMDTTSITQQSSFDVTTSPLDGKCYTSDKLILKAPAIQSWDGVTRDGTQASKATNAIKHTVSGVTDANKARLAQLTCDAQVSLLNGKLRFALNPVEFPATLEKAKEFLLSTLNCRNVTKLSDQQFMVRYGLWTLAPWLYIFDGNYNRSTFNHGPSYRTQDWMTFMLNAIGDMRITNFPSTCSFSEWMGTGKCGLEWTGLSSLLGMDVTLQLSIAKCSTHTLPELVLDCVGSGCKYLKDLHPCDTASDCDANAICQDLYSLVQSNGPTNLPDVVGDYLLSNSTSWCDIGSGGDPICGGGTKGNEDINYLVEYAMTGKGPDKPSSNLRYCIPNPNNFIDSSKLENWAVAQGSISSDSITITNWRKFDPSDVGGGGTGPGGAAPGKPELSMMLVGAAAILFYVAL